MKLYYIPTTRAVRPRWLLEEMGIPYELIRANMALMAQPEYRKLHPHAKVPVIYSDMMVNFETPEEAASNWDLPLAAISEVIEYCQTHQDLLHIEALEERRRLEEKGVSLEPKITH